MPTRMREVRILRPHQDDRTGVVIPPGEVIRVPEPEAESLRISGIGEVMDTATPPRRERAVQPRPARR